jgi:transcriptional regulator of aromatic amino acid metabolism
MTPADVTAELRGDYAADSLAALRALLRRIRGVRDFHTPIGPVERRRLENALTRLLGALDAAHAREPRHVQIVEGYNP